MLSSGAFALAILDIGLPGADGFEVARDVLLTEGRAAGEITIARFRDLIGTGRRDAQLMLERFDADGVTRRVGDRRVLRRAARGG